MRKNTNIMIAAGYTSIYGGNFIASLVALNNAVSRFGKNIIFVFPPSARNQLWCRLLAEKNITVLFLDPGLGKLKQSIELLKWTKIYQCGIIYTHFSQYDIASALCCWLRPNLKLFCHIHSDFSGAKGSSNYGSLKNRLIAYTRNYILGRKATLIFVSKHLNEQFIPLGKHSERYKYLPNALASNRFVEKSMNRDEARSMLSLMNQQIFVLMFGWSPYVKGMDIAVEAMRIARKDNPNLIISIVVGEQCNEKEVVEYINKYTNCSGREEWIYYLQPIEDVFSYHRAADIMLSSSRSEGFSYTILESLSVGNMVVNSDIKGTSWAKEYALTYTFTSENVNDCARMLLEASKQLGNTEEHKGIKIRVMEDISKQYGIRKWCNELIEILNN